MTLVSQIITDAFRQSNMIAVGASPSTAQQTEALRYLNRIVDSVYGNEAGENLQPIALGANNIQRPAGYPWYDNAPPADWFVPLNKRLVLNLTDDTTVYLHPKPEDGARLAIVDASANLNTNNLILRGNGSLIESATSYTANTASMTREWFYRADTANWMRVNDLIAADTFPFPEAFDDMFVMMLGMRLSPGYGRAMPEESQMVLQNLSRKFKARYKNVIDMASEEALLRLTNDPNYFHEGYGAYFDPSALFNRGVPW